MSRKQNHRKVKKTTSDAQNFSISLILMPLLLLIVCIGYYLLGGEVILLNNGYGWDGVTYGSFAWKFSKLLDNPVLDPYLAQRVLPSAVVHYALRACGVIPDVNTVLIGFKVLNSACLVFSGLLWAFIGKKLQLSNVSQWLGFLGLFVNVALLKMSLYYPPLTDVPAFFLSMLALYFYLLNRRIALFVVTAAAFFTFPTGFFIFAILFVFPFSEMHNAGLDVSSLPFQRIVAIFGVIGITFISAVALWFFTFNQKIAFPGTEVIFEPTLFLAVPLMLGCIVSIAWVVCGYFPWNEFFCFIKAKTFWISVASVAVLWGVLLYCRIHFLQNPDARITTPMNLPLFLGGSFSLSVAKPLLAFVSHCVYYGPFVILFAFLFRSTFMFTCSRLGMGFSIIIALFSMLSVIMCESRQLINVLPFAVLAICVRLEHLRLEWKHFSTLAVICLVNTKLWLPFNYEGMAIQGLSNLNLFPAQWYFMNHGPWMNMTSYIWQMILTLICAMIIGTLLHSHLKSQK